MARNRPEEIEQAAVFEMAKWNYGRYPELELMYHVPNGGQRTKAEAAILNGQGVNPGVMDIVLPVARRGFLQLAIEMKAPGKLSTTTPAQEFHLLRWHEEGALTLVCDSGEAAWKVIEWYVSPMYFDRGIEHFLTDLGLRKHVKMGSTFGIKKAPR